MDVDATVWGTESIALRYVLTLFHHGSYRPRVIFVTRIR